MESFDDVAKLASALVTGHCGSPQIVAIEGASGSGKTCLGRELGSVIGASVVETDPYYRTGFKGASYEDGLRLDDLEREVMRLLRGGQPLIIEGVCLRDTLEALSLTPDAFVYCKKLSATGIWNDDPELLETPPADFESVQALIDGWSLDYHRRTDPHERADFVFLRDGDVI